MINGLTQHEETVQTLEEIKAEKHIVLRVDLMILPILTITFFLASLAGIDLLELHISHYVGVLNDHRTVAMSQMPTPRA